MTNFTGDNQTFTILAGTTDTVTGTGDTIIIGAGAHVSVYGSGNASSFTDVGSFLLDYGTNDTSTVGVNNTTVDLYGNGDTANLNGTGDLIGLHGVSEGATINGNGSWAYFWGATNSTVVLNGQSEWATAAQGSGNQININGASSYASLNADNNTANLYANYDNAYSYGTGDLIGLHGVSEGATINGNGSWAYFWGATNSTVVLNGQSEWATAAQGSGNQININGASSYASLNADNNTANLYANYDNAYSYGTGDLIGLHGVYEWATINGNGSWAYFWGATNSTVVLNGQSEWATAAQGSGNQININGASSYASLNADNNTADLYSNYDAAYSYGTGDLINLHGASEGATVNGNGSNADIDNATYSTVTLNGQADFSTVNFGTVSIVNNVAVTGSEHNHIIVNGQGSGTNILYAYNTVDEYGANDTLQSATGDSVMSLHGNNEVATETGDSNTFYLSGNNDTLNNLGPNFYDVVHLSGSQSGFDIVNQANDSGIPATVYIDTQDVLASISGYGTVINNSSHLFINAAFGSLDANDNFIAGAVSSLFQQAVGLAIQFYETHATNNVVLNEDFASTEAKAAEQAALAFNMPSSTTASYQSVAAVLGSGTATITSLPSTNPFTNTPTSILLTTAQAKLYGFRASNANGVDDVVALGQNTVFDYTQSGITSTQVDAVGALEHEISEGMGRIAEAGYATVEGLHIYNPSGQIDINGTSKGDTFKINNGTTTIGLTISENAYTPGQDIADWYDPSPVATTQFGNASLSGYDSFGYAYKGHYQVVSSADATEMDALGWNFV